MMRPMLARHLVRNELVLLFALLSCIVGAGCGSEHRATSPVVSLTPTTIKFTDQVVNTTSAGHTVTVRNTGGADLAITSVAMNGDFAQTNNCGTSVAVGATCTVTVTFTPTALGAHNGSITVTDNATGSPHQVPLTGTGVSSPVVAYVPAVAAMMNAVTQTSMTDYLNKLTGVTPVTIGGTTRTLGARITGSTNSTYATQWAYERGTAAGLNCAYENWTNGGWSDRNVVCTKTGTTYPTQIVVMCAHIDTRDNGTNTVGANDNASGAATVMRTMEIMASRSFQKTIRFIIFTGEEEGLLGSGAYVAAHASDDFRSVLNMEYLGYDGGDHSVSLLTHLVASPQYPADHAIAQLGIDVSATYATAVPAIENDTSGTTDSDHARFWANGDAAVLAAGWAPNYPYYHTAGDTVDKLDLTYYTNVTKTLVGTLAHLAGPADLSASTPPSARRAALARKGAVR